MGINELNGRWPFAAFGCRRIADLMNTCVKYPPRKLQSEVRTGPMTLTKHQRFKWLKDDLEKDALRQPMPSGNSRGSVTSHRCLRQRRCHQGASVRLIVPLARGAIDC